MTKKILQLIAVLLFAAQGVMAQSVEIESVEFDPGPINVQVFMHDFTGTNGDVAAITLYIEYDADLLEYTGIDDINPLFTGVWTENGINGEIVITYSTNNSGTNINGEAFDLLFNYNGGFEGDLNFAEVGNEIANNSLGTIPNITYIDGSVYNIPIVGAFIDGQDDQIGPITVPVIMDRAYSGIVFDAFTYVIEYDPNKLVYTGFDYEDITTGITASANNGVLTIVYTGIAAFDDIWNAFYLNFNYLGGNADLEFMPGSMISYNGVIYPDVFIGGIISPADADASLTIGNAGAVPPGWSNTVVNLPIVADGFSTELGAITLNMYYDNTNMTFTGFTPETGQPTGWLVTGIGASSGEISMIWTSISGAPLVDGSIGTLNFTVFDTLTEEVNVRFAPRSMLSDIELAPVDVNFGDGGIDNALFADVKVYLEGAYDGVVKGPASQAMNTDLNSYLPMTQPYSGSPWNYTGTETVTSMPSNVVDWVLVELRTDVTAASVVATRAAFLLSNGSIVDMDGTSSVEFIGLYGDDYYIVIKHRYHLGIMSATAQPLSDDSILYDFTLNSSQCYGADALKNIGSGWVMYSGDGNANGNIESSDVTIVYLPQANETGYKTADYNMNSNVESSDVTIIYLSNANKSSQVPN